MFKIHSLETNNVRALKHLRMTNLPDTGVLVIHGDNEQGKSTILDALHVVLNQKHTANNKYTKALRPVGRDESPRVRLEATIGAVRFCVDKTWFRGKKATLQLLSPQRAEFSGDEAEERLSEVVDKHLDLDLLEVLFLRQDDLGEAVAALGIGSLNRALDARAAQGQEATASTYSEEDAGILAAVAREYEKYYTLKTGKPARELAQARDEAIAADSAAQAAQATLRELEEHLLEVERVQTEQVEAQEEVPAAEEELRQARIQEQAAKKARAEFERLSTAQELADKDLDAIEQQRTQRAQVDTDVEQARALLHAKQDLEVTAAEKAKQEEETFEELSLELAQAREGSSHLSARVREARKQILRAEQAERLQELEGLVERIKKLSAQLASLKAQQTHHEIDADTVAALEEAHAQVRLQTLVREKSSPRLLAQAPQDASVLVDGQSVTVSPRGTEIMLSEGTSLVIGEITARFSAGESEKSSADLERARETLKLLLEEAECADITAVREKREKYLALSQQVESAEQQRALVLGGRELSAVSEEVSTLRAALSEPGGSVDNENEKNTHQGTGEESSEVSRKVPSEGSSEETSAGVGTESTAQTPELLTSKQLAALEQEQELQLRKVEQLDAQLEPYRARPAQTGLAMAQALRASTQESLTHAEQRAAQVRGERSDEELELAHAQAKEKQLTAAAAVVQARTHMQDLDPELASQLSQGASARLENLKTQVHAAEIKLASLTSQISQAQGAAEDAARTEAVAVGKRRQAESLERRAAAAKLLWETLLKHREAARARYAQPFRDALEKLARTVFGAEVEFSLSDDLEITHRSSPEGTVELGALSGGAREQLAILTRFAIASLLTETESYPVVVDDALGSTDAHRLKLMATLFARMGQTHQVIVLTCYPQRYDRVPDHLSLPMEELKNA